MITADPMTTVRQYIDGFNRGDLSAMAAAFVNPGWILDGIAPHVWHGPTAAQDCDITGDSAYVIVPASVTFKAHGKQVMQSGATLTMALRTLADGWRMAAWAIAKGNQA